MNLFDLREIKREMLNCAAPLLPRFLLRVDQLGTGGPCDPDHAISNGGEAPADGEAQSAARAPHHDIKHGYERAFQILQYRAWSRSATTQELCIAGERLCIRRVSPNEVCPGRH